MDGQERFNYYCASRRSLLLRNYQTGHEFVDTLCSTAREDTPCKPRSCGASLMYPFDPEHVQRGDQQPRSREVLLRDAKEFIEGYYSSLNRPSSDQKQLRCKQVHDEIQSTGTYELTTQELTYGAKMAWRNASRCVGRSQWNKLTLFDARYVTTCEQMFEAICNHIKYSTNKGNLRSAITVFPHRIGASRGFRVWNKQYIMYAGYLHDDSSVTGDAANVEFTKVCQHLGWKGCGGSFDILPIVVSINDSLPELFSMPDNLVLEVTISHPKFRWMRDFGLKWYALPAVSSMLFDCGGLEFTAAPFSGWYMSTEIAARNLSDPHRYNMLEPIAKCMGLETSTVRSLWKDKALVELNIAVLHSYQEARVTIVDHHTSTESFLRFMEVEHRVRGGCPADWVWLVPPMSASTTPLFHQEMCRYVLRPAYTDQSPIWTRFDWSRLDPETEQRRNQKKHHFKGIVGLVQLTSQLYGEAMSRRIKATILYATETGRSRTFAKMLEQVLSHAFNAKAICMDDYDLFGMEHESLLFIVASTFGNGDPPENGELFYKSLENMDRHYHLLSSSTSTMASCDGESRDKSELGRILSVSTSDITSTPARTSYNEPVFGGAMIGNRIKIRRPTLMSPFFRSFSIPKFMLSQAINNCKGVENMTEPSTPESMANKSSWLAVESSNCSINSSGALANVRYAVFALGSSAYPNFCCFGKNVDSMLADLSAERLVPVTCGDELNGQETSFRAWSIKAFTAACEAFCLDNVNVKKAQERLVPDTAANQAILRLVPVTSSLCVAQEIDAKRPRPSEDSTEQLAEAAMCNTDVVQPGKLAAALQQTHGRHVHVFRVQHLQRLHESCDGRSTILVVLSGGDLSEGQVTGQIDYQPGDHLAVYPHNRSEIVHALLQRIGSTNHNQAVQLEVFEKIATLSGKMRRWRRTARLPCANLTHLFTHFLDITSPPSQTLLHTLSALARDQQQQTTLRSLAQSSAEYERWKHAGWPSIPETLHQFDSVDVNAAVLLDCLPLLQPRMYSVSSSCQVYPNQVHLTVAVVEYVTQNGNTHYGVCSNYLKNVEPGDFVVGYLRSGSAFHMPEMSGDSLLMIGPGTGVAPFRSFWQQRQYQLQHAADASLFGKMMLFFGCRNRRMNLYCSEKEQLFADGVLSANYLALSRQDGHKKEYVQNQLMTHCDDVIEVLTSRAGHVYICGDCTMAQDVIATLKQVLVQHAGFNVQQANNHMAQMEREERFHQDIFGITLRTAEVTKKTRAMLAVGDLQ